MSYITAKYIFDGSNLLINKAINIESGKINIVDYNENILNCKNLGNGVITSGFIDLQINGCGGVLFNDNISYETILTMQKTCSKFGTTHFLPTLITTNFENIKKALQIIDIWIKENGYYNGVIGIHLEGPFISFNKKGIHQKDYIIKPRVDILKYIISYAKKFPIFMTIAPECFTKEEIKYLKNNQVILSVGHSSTTYQDIIEKIPYGLTTATHLFNAMSGITARDPGVIGAILNSNLYAGFIADLLHVDPVNIEISHKLKQEQLYLVTDAVTPMGDSSIESFMFAGKKIFVKNGKCEDENGVLAGANINLPTSVRNCIVNCNIKLEDALKMVTLIPARVMGMEQNIGNIFAKNAKLVYMSLDDYSCINIDDCLST
jgi:N-acetylglucosamine-6-phosphate deacetylase